MKTFRKYGHSPFSVAVIHGGPGAAGEMAPVAIELSRLCGILEPFQTKTTIDGQVEELYSFLKKQARLPVTLIGFSWGAWLSLIFAARHPDMAGKVILISSGPFEDKYSEGIMKTRLERLSQNDRREVEFIMGTIGKNKPGDNSRLMARFGALIMKADSCNVPRDEGADVEIRYDIYDSIWKEASELRSSGRLLETAASIKCPVVAIHGDYDPHPAAGVELPLRRILKDFRFILLPACGHYPWKEKEAGKKFFDLLGNEMN